MTASDVGAPTVPQRRLASVVAARTHSRLAPLSLLPQVSGVEVLGADVEPAGSGYPRDVVLARRARL